MDQKAKCIVCGKEYDVCLSCRDVKEYRPWRTVCDTIDCYKLFLVVSGYNNGHTTKDEAKKQLSKINYDLDSLKESTKKTVQEIMAEPKKNAVKNANK